MFIDAGSHTTTDIPSDSKVQVYYRNPVQAGLRVPGHGITPERSFLSWWGFADGCGLYNEKEEIKRPTVAGRGLR